MHILKNFRRRKNPFLGLLFSVLIVGARQLSAADNGNNFINFSGSPQTLNTSMSNAFTGESFLLLGSYNVNNAVYDGLGGNDTMLFTQFGDYLSLRGPLNSQSVLNIEVFVLGDGNDVLNLSDSFLTYGGVTISGGSGNDLIWGNIGGDTIFGSAGNDKINGGGGNDNLQGNDGDDSIYFGAGYGSAFADGGNGFDEIVFGPGLSPSDLTITSFGDPSNLGFNIVLLDGSSIHSTLVEQLRFSDGSMVSIPEPSTYALLTGIGTLGVVVMGKRRSTMRRLVRKIR